MQGPAVERGDLVTGTVVTIDGSSLTCAQVAAVARQRATVAVAGAAQDAARAAWQVAQEVAAKQPVYGRTTGVGANHVVPISERDRTEHGLRLLRSHAAGTGPLLAPEVARGMLAIRANQLGTGGSGVDPALLAVLADLVGPDHQHGAGHLRREQWPGARGVAAQQPDPVLGPVALAERDDMVGAHAGGAAVDRLPRGNLPGDLPGRLRGGHRARRHRHARPLPRDRGHLGTAER